MRKTLLLACTLFASAAMAQTSPSAAPQTGSAANSLATLPAQSDLVIWVNFEKLAAVPEIAPLIPPDVRQKGLGNVLLEEMGAGTTFQVPGQLKTAAFGVDIDPLIPAAGAPPTLGQTPPLFAILSGNIDAQQLMTSLKTAGYTPAASVQGLSVFQDATKETAVTMADARTLLLAADPAGIEALSTARSTPAASLGASETPLRSYIGAGANAPFMAAYTLTPQARNAAMNAIRSNPQTQQMMGVPGVQPLLQALPKFHVAGFMLQPGTGTAPSNMVLSLSFADEEGAALAAQGLNQSLQFAASMLGMQASQLPPGSPEAAQAQQALTQLQAISFTPSGNRVTESFPLTAETARQFMEGFRQAQQGMPGFGTP